MFSDTHFHLSGLKENNIDLEAFFQNILKSDYKFLLDIGTQCDDYLLRTNIFKDCLSKIDNNYSKENLQKIFFFACGIWPSVEAIKDRENQLKILKEQINNNKDNHLIAIGECGLDHHWNPSGIDGRNQDDFSKDVYIGEQSLFEEQIELAKKLSLPLIVHSREAFTETYDCLKNVGYFNGIIHCYSYGIEDARKFLDLGYYIALGGGITYTKKSKQEDMNNLIKYIPFDRLLLETDAPYLAPVPYRGQINTPLLISEVYKVIASIRGITIEQLSAIVFNNVKALFHISN